VTHTPTKIVIGFIRGILQNKYNNTYALTLLLSQFIVHIAIGMRHNI